MSIAANYGFGQRVAIVPHDDIPRAVLFEAIGQSFVVMGMATSKMSLGFFFLRIVQEKWQRAMIWTVMSMLMVASLICTLFFWFRCTPFRYLWDHNIPNGHCGLPLLPSAIVLGSESRSPRSICPVTNLLSNLRLFRFLLRRLPMDHHVEFHHEPSRKIHYPRQYEPRRHVLPPSFPSHINTNIPSAGAFGIVRSTQIPSLLSPDYLRKYHHTSRQLNHQLTPRRRHRPHRHLVRCRSHNHNGLHRRSHPPPPV